MKTNVILNSSPVILRSCPVILSAAKNLFQLVVITCMTSGLLSACHEDLTTDMVGGEQVDEVAFNAAPAITLRSPKSADGVVNVLITEGAGFASERIFATSSRPADLPQTIVLEADTTLVEAYRHKSGIDYKVLPEAFYKFEDSRILDLAQDATESASTLLKIFATNPVGNTLEAGRYLLPVVAKASSQSVSTTLYYRIVVRSPFKGDAELYEGDDAFVVFYINTERYDPRLVTDFYLSKGDMSSPSSDFLWYGAMGNIVNLRKVTITYDAYSGRAILNLGTDIQYVLDHYDKYIRPLQETGRKVCLSIEGANKGVGFCNLSDEQIIDFAQQVQSTIQMYNLDGINLWDRTSGYDLPDAIPTNTTSYPKLIKSLREVLGADKLLTLTDYGEPTEYFWDLNATEGIRVGDYLDYAWSGYNRLDEGYQIVDPYHPEAKMISILHVRKPIPGLNPQRYGCINAPWGTASLVGEIGETQYENIVEWVMQGMNQNNICVYEDLRTNLQDKLEGMWNPGELVQLYHSADMGYMFFSDMSRLRFVNGKVGYNKWFKDW